MVGLKNGILLDGIAIIILTFFLPHTLKLQNPKFCGVSQTRWLLHYWWYVPVIKWFEPLFFVNVCAPRI
jgi:hypothetical protein